MMNVTDIIVEVVAISNLSAYNRYENFYNRV